MPALSKYKAITQIPLSENNVFAHPPRPPEVVHYEDPALDVMTDLTRIQPVVVRSDVTIKDAELEMKACNVHMLLVSNDNQTLLGLITSEDIIGEKPIKMAMERQIQRDQVLVRMIMSPQEHTLAIDIDSILHARVGDIIETLHAMKKHHALVVEVDPNTDKQTIRGLFSSSQISRQLDQNIIDDLSASRSLLELRKSMDW